MGDPVINVECTKQDVVALSAIQSESYSLTTGELGRVPREDNETDLAAKYPQLDDGCCIARHSWSGTAQLCVCCIRTAPANWKCTCDRRTSGCMAAKRHDFEKHAKRDNQPLKRD